MIEFADAIGGVQNESLKDSAFTFSDDLSTKELIIRPDISQQIARIDQAEASDGEKRYCYVGEVLKKRKDSFSRSRITVKAGIEIFGGGDNKFEILKLLSESMVIGNLKDLTLSFGKTEILDSILEPLNFKSKSDLLICLDEFKIERTVVDKLLTLIDCNGDLSVISTLKKIQIDENIINELEEIWNFVDNETSFKPHIDVTDFPGFNYHKGLVFSAHSADLGFSIANGGNYFSQTASGSTRSAIGFVQDIIAMTKLKVKKWQIILLC